VNWAPKVRSAAVDGDLYVHGAANKHNKEDTNEGALSYIERELTFLRDTLELDDWTIFLTAGGNFRKDISPTYKLHRAKREKPKYLLDCYRYLYEQWGAVSERGLEADDLLGIACTENPERLLVSYDKDLRQIPGWHYDTRNFTLSYVNPQEAERFFLTQLLMGDAADNVQGIKGIGPVKAGKLLAEHGYSLPSVLGIYRANDLPFEDFASTYKLLKILTTREMKWPELDELCSQPLVSSSPQLPSSSFDLSNSLT
jgi:DNA polymerase-1